MDNYENFSDSFNSDIDDVARKGRDTANKGTETANDMANKGMETAKDGYKLAKNLNKKNSKKTNDNTPEQAGTSNSAPPKPNTGDEISQSSKKIADTVAKQKPSTNTNISENADTTGTSATNSSSAITDTSTGSMMASGTSSGTTSGTVAGGTSGTTSGTVASGTVSSTAGGTAGGTGGTAGGTAGATAGATAGGGVAAAAAMGWAALIIIVIILIMIMVITAIAYTPTSVLTFTEKIPTLNENKGINTATMSATSSEAEIETIDSDTSSLVPAYFSLENAKNYLFSIQDLTDNIEIIKQYYKQNGSFNREKLAKYKRYVKSLAEVLENANYTGDSYFGQSSYVFKSAFDKTLNYVYDAMMEDDVNAIISKYKYEPERTIQSFKNEANPNSNINFAEMIAVMSLGGFTLNEGSLNELFDILKDENNIEKLYSLSVTEKPVTTAVLLESETTSSYLYSLDDQDTTEVGEITSSIILPINQLSEDIDVNDLSVLNELYQDVIDSEKESMEEEIKEMESEISSSIIKEGRYVIFPCGKIPTIEFKTYCSANDVEVTKKLYETNGFTVEYEIIEQKITYSTEAHVTYIYGDIEINPYTLTDLFDMFGVDPYGKSVDFPTLNNIEIIDSTELGIRTFVPDINFGRSDRTSLNNSYSSFGLTTDELLNLLASYENGDLSVLQTSVIDLCVSCDGTPYSQPQRMNGPGSGFDCSSFTSWVYAQLGIYFSSGTYWEEGNKGHAPVAANICKYLENNGCEISSTELVVGDLVFWNYSNKNHDRYKVIDHVAIYVGNGMVYEASGSAGKVRTREIYGVDKIVSYCRPTKLFSQKTEVSP